MPIFSKHNNENDNVSDIHMHLNDGSDILKIVCECRK